MKKIMYITASIVALILVSSVIIINQTQFGKSPSGERLWRIRKSPNYKNGSFHNQSITPVMAEEVSYFTVFKEMLFDRKKRVIPTYKIPSVSTDLKHMDKNKDVLVWFGHSSYFIQIDGKRILVDPVFSGNASPFSFSIKAFPGTNSYSADDIPDIDYLFISHDHWDHLDYETVVKLKPRINKVICGLGVGEDFEYWGFDKKSILELDWNEHIALDRGFEVVATPARHFSGRGFVRNKTLWASFVLRTPTMNLFLGGDGGYDKHFAEIGKNYGPFDLAILENGQYDKNWKYIHLLPDDLMDAFKDLRAKKLFPVHSSKFALSKHPWDEPLIKVIANCKEQNISLITPMIGEQVDLNDSAQKFSEWWKGCE